MATTHNLPLQLTSFVGREREQADVRALLATTRLLTLTGAGGAGKTRIALRVAESLVGAYSDGVWLIELASLADGLLALPAVAATVGVMEQPGHPLIDALTDGLRTRHALLVLDNCEHLLAACADLADALLRKCPQVRILATSREALGLAGEIAWTVPSLSLPDAQATAAREHLDQFEAVQLFVERARAALPGFTLSERNGPAIAEVCRRLDGMPLAIELAAARVKLLTVEQIATRLDDRFRLLTSRNHAAPSRQQTLQATIDWSYGLLTGPERRLFDRLSIFAGGWSLTSAEAITSGDGIEKDQVLDLLGRLVDKSLVLVEHGEHAEARYRLLETLRQYGQERLRAYGKAETVARRHAAFFIDYVEHAERAFFGPDEPRALRWMEPEHDNIRGALRWLIATGDVEQCQRLGGAFGMVWFFRSALTEGRAWITELLALPGGDAPTAARAQCLFVAGLLAMTQGDHVAAQIRTEEALRLWRLLKNDRQATAPLFLVGLLARMRDEFDTAQAHLREAVSLGHAAGNHAYEALSLMALSDTAISQGDFATARTRAAEAIACATAVGWDRGLWGCVRSLADACFEQQDDSAARQVIEECVATITMHERALAPWWLIPPLVSLGRIAAAQGEFARADTALAEALALCGEIGDRSGIAAGLETAAYLAATRGQFERAVRLEAAAAVMRESTRGSLSPVSPRVRRQLARAAGELDPTIRAAAQRHGQGMTIEAAIAYALAAPEAADLPRHMAARPIDALPPREREVVALVARGLSNLEIATQLVISERTVESHVRNALGKLGMRSRARLASWAVEHQLLGVSSQLA